ncbi:FG-GAP-like repeat-containing protein [Actinoplanes sp. NPDC049668]|uniref:FG-GAP-like repeat-containing protein n=1 Tax=unclassified Actinoplanes TaxID=2626549 RepID=UPI0033AC81BD
MGVRASAAVVLVCGLLASDLVGMRPEAQSRAGGPDASGPGGYTDVRVEVPAFRGLEPALRLSYDAGAPNGWLGVGWSLSGLSEITRLAPGRGVPSHTDQDEFHLDGLRLVRCRAGGAAPVRSPGCEHPSSPAAQGYATQVEGYRRIEFEPSAAGGTWRVWNRDGTRLTYRPRLPVGTDPAAWHLAGVQDPRGNQVAYSYSQNADPLGTGREYPRAISYNGVVVTFHSEPRPDPIDQADGRALVVTRHRLKSIDVQVHGERLRAYALRYETRTGTTSRSMLRAVQQYGRDAVLDGSGTVVSGTAAPALTLTAQAGPAPAAWWAAEPVATIPDPGPRWNGSRPGSVFRDQVVDREFHQRPRDPEDTPYTTGDINGDDRTDWIKVNANDDAGPARVEITTGVSDRGLVPTSVSEILPWPDPDGWGDPLDRGLQVWATDVNADGSDDLILTVGHRRGRPVISFPVGGQTAPQVMLIFVALSEHDGTFRLLPSFTETSWIDNPNSGFDMLCQPGDANGDGRADLVCVYSDPFVSPILEPLNQYLGTALGRGDGTFTTASVAAPDRGSHRGTPDLAVGDADADGRADVSLAFRHRWWTGFGRGDGTYSLVDHQTAFHGWNGRLRAADVNGDGRADLLRVVTLPGQPTRRGLVQTLVSQRGGGWLAREDQVPDRLVGDERYLMVHVTAGDADGDGNIDLLFPMLTEAHPATACSPAFDRPHTSFTRVFGVGDGTFRWPASWTDCGASSERAYTFDDLLTWQGVHAPDVDGDGLADLFGMYSDAGPLIAVDDVSPRTGADSARRSIGADVDGDGRQDTLYVHPAKDSTTIYALLRRPGGGYLQRAQRVLPGRGTQVARNWKVGDVNADGRADLIYLVDEPGRFRITSLLADGAGGWTERTRVAWPNYVAQNPGESGRDDPGWRTMDVNGDGRTDLIHLYRADQVLRINTLLSTGDAAWTPRPGRVPGEPPAAGPLSWQQADVNGDGRTDLVRVRPVAGGGWVDTVLSTGDGLRWRRATQPFAGTHLAVDARRWLVADANGDGKADLVRPDRTATGISVRSLLAHGDGRWRPENAADAFPNPFADDAAIADTARWRVTDVNHDGRSDLLHLLPFRLPPHVPGGQPELGLRIDTLTSLGQGVWRPTAPVPNALPGYASPGALEFAPADADGDADADLVRLDLRAGSLQVTTIRAAAPPDLLVGVDNGLGARTSIGYRPSSAFRTRSPPAPELSGCHLPHGVVLNLPAAVELRVAGTSPARAEYDYSCARWSYTDRRLLGWARTATTQAAAANRPARSTVQHYRIDDTCLVRPVSSFRQDAAGRLLGRTVTSYLPTGGRVPATCLPETAGTWEYDTPTGGGPAVGRESRIAYAYDRFGNVERFQALGDPADPGDDQVIRRRFRPATQPWIVDAPAGEELRDGTGATSKRLRDTGWCYDGDNGPPRGACPGVPGRLGLLTAVKRLDDRGRYLTTTLTYDAFGNRTSVTDALGHTTTTTYDPERQLLPERVCNALRQCTVTDWDRRQGLITAFTDANGARLETDPDPFGRPATVRQPGRGAVRYSYLDWNDPARRRIREVRDDGTPDGLWSETFLDGLDRPTGIEREGDQPGRTFVRHLFYSDAAARPAATTNWFSLPAGEAPVVERYAYDADGRLTSHTHADGAIRRWTYRNDDEYTWVDETDERGDTTTRKSDAHGRLAVVEQRDHGTVSRLRYGYDAAGRLRTMTDDQGNVSRWYYTLLGEVAAIDDPDLGVWRWTWDPAGNRDTQTDARGRRLRYRYDAANRPVAEIRRDGSEFRWHYDEPGHGAGIGQLTSVGDPTGQGCPGGRSRSLRYHPGGDLAEDLRCVGGDRQAVGFEWDGLGRQLAVTYPDGERQTYGYDTAGRLRDMPGLVGEFRYDPDGNPTWTERADSTVTAWTWDPKRRWLNEISTASPVTGPLLRIGYTHEPDGLVRTESVTPPGRQLSFTYDGLDRLTEVTGALAEHLSWDTVGNLRQSSVNGGYTYPPPGPAGCGSGTARAPCRGPHAASSIAGERYYYDANGNTVAVGDAPTYTVRAKQPGRRRDTLWAIAADRLGDPRRWPEIFALNRGERYPDPPGGRFTDPHWIYPGQRLRLPPAAGAAGCTAGSSTTPAMRHLAWDDDNRLVMVEDEAGRRTCMRYDADGTRVETRHGTRVRRYFGPWLEAGARGADSVKFYWAGSTLIAGRDRNGLHFFHTDRLGSTRLLTTGTGAVGARYDYRPSGASPGPQSAATDLRFTGQRQDPWSGLIQMGDRYYEPKTARFLSPDSVVPDRGRTQSGNRYLYAYGNPLGWTDATGHQPDDASDPDDWAPWPYEADPGTPDWSAEQALAGLGDPNLWADEIDVYGPAPLLEAADSASNMFSYFVSDFFRHTDDIFSGRDAQYWHARNPDDPFFDLPAPDPHPWRDANGNVVPVAYGIIPVPLTLSGPVLIRAPPAATAAEIAELEAYIKGSNEAISAGKLSPTGRVPTSGALRTAASQAAAAERAAAAARGAPYQGHAGHVPDTTWMGRPEPHSWLDLSPRVNMSVGGQAPQYPLGYQPTEFILVK